MSGDAERLAWALLNRHDERALDAVRDRLVGALWLEDDGTRGPYAYDDPGFRKEFGAALREAIAIVNDALRTAPPRPITLGERNAILRAEDDRLRCPRCHVEWADWDTDDRINHAREHADE